MNEPPIRPSLAGQGGPRERSPVGMLEGFSESVPRQGFQGWRISAARSSSSCVFKEHHPIFGPSRARAGSGTPAARQRRTSRESGDPWSAPGRGQQEGASGQNVRGGPAAGNASRAESGAGNPAVWEAQGGGRPCRRGRFIVSPRGRRRGGLHPGYWPPADPPRRCVHWSLRLACPSTTSGIVCSTPTYLRSRLRLRVEAHAGILDETRKLVVRFGSGPEAAGRRRPQSGRRRRSPLPTLSSPSDPSFPVALEGANLFSPGFRSYPRVRSDYKSR